jgi:DNA-binding transcriptional MerR regulator
VDVELGPLAVELRLRDVARVREARSVFPARAEHRRDEWHGKDSEDPWYQASNAEALVTGGLFADGLSAMLIRVALGYRFYTEHDVKRLAFIQRAKLMGLPLGKIKDLVAHLSETECACPKIRPHLEHLIREQIEDIAGTIDQLGLLRKDLTGFLTKMGRAKPALPAELWRVPEQARAPAAPSVSKIRRGRGRG